ncbi:MAG: AAA family ATPase [Geobacteraceae bacterium GWC2_58_44]|nr:MAG: AAA family ATPase [Geobacteraceae bacterium GWC2_58_44]HBG08243.1 AAA family ATPase [Geobacter sp.]
MYWEHFGFKEPPFALTPNPAFLFLSSPHQEAFAHLLFAIESRAGFIELSGEVGTGKTTIVRTLLNQLDPQSYRTALIFNPTLSPLGLLKEINDEFGLASAGDEMRDLHQALNRFLLEENRAGRTVVLVIDEAQNLSVEVLEHIRLISNLETDSDKLIQIVLVGQPELKKLLARPELRQLDQRITVRYHLKPMCFADSCDYIRHRIRFAASGREPLAFSPGAVKRIFRYSGGLPRLINGVCDRALLLAYTRGCKEVSPSMAALSIADLGKGASRRPRRALQGVAASLLLVSLAAAAFMLLRGAEEPQAKTPPQQAAPVLSREALLNALGALSEQENLHAAVNAVLSRWQAPPVLPVPGQAATLRTLARQRGVTATRIAGNLDAVARLDAPALLHVAVPGAGPRMLALTAIDKDGVSVVPSLAGRSKLTREELALLWSGGATLFWKDFHAISSRVKPAEKVEGVRRLQGLLKQVGCYNGPLDGNPGSKTKAAIAEFQGREQVLVDGQATGQTLLLLYRRAGGFFPPALHRAAE